MMVMKLNVRNVEEDIKMFEWEGFIIGGLTIGVIVWLLTYNYFKSKLSLDNKERGDNLQ